MSDDIIIVGGGMAGSALALALVQQTSLSIAILEAQSSFESWSASQYGHRVSAIALSSQRIFQSLGMWQAVKNKRVSPFTQIQAWDAMGRGHIDFDCKDIAESVLGYIIENNAIQEALVEQLKSHPQITFLSPIKLTTFREQKSGIELVAADGSVFQAKLAVAGDGAQSWLREAAGIELKVHDYEQEAIVATVATAMSHQQIARQVFLGTGPLAFLPLAEMNTSSIVWSLPITEAKRLMGLDNNAFCHQLASAFEHRLGAVTMLGQRYAFPLRKQQTKQYVKSHVVLIGDAAHTVHPLAGQGVNMGLLDAACLSEVVVEAIQQRRDFASHANLRRYERWRKADNLSLLAGIDLIKNDTLRSLGLAATNKWHVIKNIFTRHATGNRTGLPKLAQATNTLLTKC